MGAENLKVPLKGDGKFGLEFTRDCRRKNSRKLHLLTGVTFLIVVNVSLFIVVMFALSRVRNLENQVNMLESDLAEMKVQHDIVLDAILGDEDEDVSEEDQGDDTQFLHEMLAELSDLIHDDDYSEYDIDQEVRNLTEENDIGESQANPTENLTTLGDFRHANGLTKDGKDTPREKRSIVAATQDGVLINSESYADRKAKNMTRHRIHTLKGYNVTPVSAKPSYFGVSPYPSSYHYNSEESTAAPHVPSYRRDHTKHPKSAPVFTRRSRVMHNEDRSKAFRQVVKKSSLKSGDSYSDETTADSSFTIVRDDFPRRRSGQRRVALENLDENHPRVGRVKLASAHFNGDTSRYVVGQHTNFNGNGHLRHPQRTFVDWKISDWVKSAGMDTQFNMEDGVLTIKEPGIYFVYAQIYYLDEHDTTGFRVHKNGETILQCTVTAHSSERRLKGNTCYTAGAEYLSEGDRLSLADVTSGRYSLFEPGKSFFGLIKLGDVKIN